MAQAIPKILFLYLVEKVWRNALKIIFFNMGQQEPLVDISCGAITAESGARIWCG